MRIQYKSKMYTLKSFDVEKDQFVTANGIKLRLSDIEAIVLDRCEFENLKHVEQSSTETNVVIKSIEPKKKKNS